MGLELGTQTFPSCTIVIVNYNGRRLLEQFLPSVIQQDYPNFEVLVVDNASRDGSITFLKSTYPQIKIIANQENFGTAEGSNIGLRHTTSEYILWLSNDMELDPASLRKMIEVAETSERIGICTCKMRRITARGEKLNIIDSVGAELDFLGFPSARGINEADEGQLDEVCEVFFSFGGAMLVKRDLVKKIGLYDPKFFTLADDIDFCWRAHLAGFKIVTVPTALLYHRVSATLGTVFGRSEKRFMAERNTLRMLLKNYLSSTLVRLIPAYLGLLMAEISLFVILRKLALVKADVRAITWNILHFRDTWCQHLLAQRIRALSDKEIRDLMYHGSYKVRILKDFLAKRETTQWLAYFSENTRQMKVTS